jgi:3-phenylpropionate/trans-cinnamate dioxygenase ferredoxin subunit
VASDGPGDVRLDEDRKFVTCPWHGWEFDLVTGRSYCDPKKVRVKPYPVEVASGKTLADGRVEGPFGATILPVAVEDDYLVVTIGRRVSRQADAG